MVFITKQDKVFIAGSTGMVGSAIKRKFLEKGYCQKNLLTPSKKELNLLEETNVKRWFENKKPNIVIVAAAKVGGILANNLNPADFIIENLKIQTNIIDNAWKSNVKRLLFLGSSCIYPRNCPQPIKEEYLLTGSLEKTNEYYALAKIAGIKLCDSLRKQYNFDAISLMPSNLYGPGDNYHDTNSHVIASFIRKFSEASNKSLSEVICWGSGNPLREFLHVDDLANAILFVLENWDPNFKNSPLDADGSPLSYLNVGTGKDISIKELAYLIAKLTKFQGVIKWDDSKPDGTFKKKLDISKLNKLGWHAEINLNDGLKETIQEFIAKNKL
tara:strand:- start:29777 stop:30763 length:987 start_codon:yes stop_codon:yes gene_type:complete